MAFRPVLRQRALAPATAGLFAAGFLLFPTRTAYAEAPESESSKKPIYDNDLSSLPSSSPSTSESISSVASSLVNSLVSSSRDESSNLPTPTDRLAAQIGKGRLFLHDQVSAAEDKFNGFMSSLLNLESDFTSTVASLAPAKETGERLMPGAMYVLVASMAGSIISRNRGILLRATVPLAVGIGAGWLVLPVTMRNVSDLAWRYEERFPVIRDNHLRIRGAAEQGWYMTKVHSDIAVSKVDEKVAGVRETIENWVKQGK
ncbi:putative mitochondrial protein [Xylona heveae TC161]|uniref:MICOS complex subunit n=1 Tax=Xylona heveae (strain CBS 132557 / TC161) TaxID=1328760 RepID=A0A165GMB7_XYLHT|nr:putative mitochondrial protein [Xylona heveae TC161]KZF22366.1 putative mitochondrial protein [Xylona heveae TC161]